MDPRLADARDEAARKREYIADRIEWYIEQRQFSTNTVIPELKRRMEAVAGADALQVTEAYADAYAGRIGIFRLPSENRYNEYKKAEMDMNSLKPNPDPVGVALIRAITRVLQDAIVYTHATAEGYRDEILKLEEEDEKLSQAFYLLPTNNETNVMDAMPARRDGVGGLQGMGVPDHMVGGANSYYHSDTETFVHVTIGKQPLKLEAGRPIWVTRSTDPHAPMTHKADEDLYPHYFKLVKKAKLFLLSGAHGKFTDSIKRELHDFINQRPNDKDKADLKEELEEVFDDAAHRGIWTTDAGADYRLVLFMRKILPENENYDGFVRDINPYPVTETEICFFDQTILREIPRPPGDSKAQASLRQGMRDAAKEEVATRQAARAAFSVQMKKARDEAALAVLDAQDRGEAAPAAPDAAPTALIARGIPHHMRRGEEWQAGMNRRR